MMRAKCFVAVLIIALIVGGLIFGVLYAQSWFSVGLEYLRYGYTLPSNVERRTATIDGESVSFLVVHLDDSMTWGFANDPSGPRSVHEWREALDADLVINGSYFTETNDPAGYYSIDGNANGTCPVLSSDSRVVFGYTFGVWVVDQRLDFGYMPDILTVCGGPELPPVTAFSSFPTLVADNVSLIEKDSELKARRTMLAETVGGEQMIVITESGEVTLYDAAQWFLEQDEDYAVVGNLDGGPSTGISMEEGRWDIEVPSAAVPNVIYGLRR